METIPHRHVFVETKHIKRIFCKSTSHAEREIKKIKKHFNIVFPHRLTVNHVLKYYNLTYEAIAHVFDEDSYRK